MLDLIDELTNWYIRFNRRRLKGENGIEDTTAALQTLFETLFTLCRTLVGSPMLSQRLRSIDRFPVLFHSLHHREHVPGTSEILPARNV